MNESGSSQRIARMATLATGAIGLLALAGWAFHVAALRSLAPGQQTMSLATATCFVLAALQLTCLDRWPAAVRGHRLLRVPALLVAAVGLLTVVLYSVDLVSGGTAALDAVPVLRLFWLPASRLALLTATLFILVGCALWLLDAGSQRGGAAAHALIVPVVAGGYLVVLSYLLRVSDMHEFLGVRVAFNTGLAFCSVSAAILAMRPGTWLTRVLTGHQAGSVMARRLLPVLLLIPPVVGWLRLFGERSGSFSSPVGVVLVAVAYSLVLWTVVWLTAKSANRADLVFRAQERKSQQALEESRDLLEADLKALTRMHELCGRAPGTLGIEPLLKEAMDTAVTIAEADKGTLQLLEGDALRIVAHHGHARSFLDFFSAAENVASVCGEATRRGERVILPDVEKSPIFAGTESLSVLRAAGVRAVQSTPLRTRGGRLLGILTTQWAEPKSPDEHSLRRLDLLARQTADVIEQKRAEEALWRQSTALGAINRVLELGLGERTEEEFCMACLGVVEEATGSKISYLDEITPDGLLRALAISDPGWDVCKMQRQAGRRQLPGDFPIRGLTGQVLISGKSLFVNAPTSHPDWNGLPAGHPEVTSFLGVPLRREGQTAGLIAVANREGGYGIEEQEILEALAPAVVEALDRKRVQTALREAKEGLEQRVEKRTGDLSRAVSALEDEVAHRLLAEDALRERSEQLRSLASALTLAEQHERRRLAQVLHDNLQQLLVGAKYRLARLERADDDAVRRAASEVQALLDQSIDCSRSLTGELSPPILHEAGLVAGLEWLAVWMQQKHGLNVELSADADADPESEDLTVLLFQAVRELLFNAAKHAGVKTARVELRRIDAQVAVTVADDGAGFDPQAALPGKDGGFGLFSLRERLGFLGGTLEIDSAPGRGSRVTLRAPLPAIRPLETPTTPAGRRIARPLPAGSVHPDEHKTRVLLVDDHVVVRQALSHLLRVEPDIEVVAEVSDGEAAVEMVRRLMPDLVVMDINMPGMDGIEATRAIQAEFPQVQVIGLSMFEEGERAQAMRDAGAVKYLSKIGPSEALLAAIRACRGSKDSRGGH